MWGFIVNPAAGNGRGRAIFERLQKTDVFKSIKSVYHYSEYEGHAEKIAEDLSGKGEIEKIIVVGGDGTIHEVINGLTKHTIPIGFIPAGSGNDFARGIGIKGSPESILERLIYSSITKTYWLGTYKHGKAESRYFVNSMGFGFDAEIAHTANHSFHKKIFNYFRFGTGSYVIALLQVLTKFQAKTLEITIDGKKRIVEDCLLLSVGNHPYYGGGMKIMPNAKIQSGKFSVLLIHSVPKWKVLSLFMTVFIGSHEKISGVELLEASSLSLRVKKPLYMQVDGQTSNSDEAVIKKNKDSIPIISIG